MQLALYCPDYGYYEKDLYSPGRDGDFYTSVSVGSLLGELLAYQIDSWYGNPIPEGTLAIIEGGAHNGALAADILNWFRDKRPQTFERIEYWLLESSTRRKSVQAARLEPFKKNVFWSTDIGSLPRTSRSEFRIFISNEFLDALPVHRLGWNSKTSDWFEWGVEFRDGQFSWARMTPDPSTLEAAATLVGFPTEFGRMMPESFTIEICPAAICWWRTAAAALQRGKLLTLDYGLTAEEFLVPERKDGTLRGYYQHRIATDLLARPGEQDLTAHVNFTALQKAGEASGLVTEAFLPQERFLGEIAARAISDPTVFGTWNPRKGRQLQTLTHPEFLGRRFRVLLQSTQC